MEESRNRRPGPTRRAGRRLRSLNPPRVPAASGSPRAWPALSKRFPPRAAPGRRGSEAGRVACRRGPGGLKGQAGRGKGRQSAPPTSAPARAPGRGALRGSWVSRPASTGGRPGAGGGDRRRGPSRGSTGTGRGPPRRPASTPKRPRTARLKVYAFHAEKHLGKSLKKNQQLKMLELTSRGYRVKKRPVCKLPRLALRPRDSLKSYKSHLFGPGAGVRDVP